MKTTGKHIKQMVSRTLGISEIDMVSARRDRGTVLARQVAAWLMCRYTILSLPRIARLLGRADHSTIIHARDRVEAALDQARCGQDNPLATTAWQCEALLVAELQQEHERLLLRERMMEEMAAKGRTLEDYLAEQKRRNRQRRLMFLRLHVEGRRHMRYRVQLPPIRRPRLRPLRQPDSPRLHGQKRRSEHERFDRQVFLNSLRIHPEREIAK